MKWSANLRALKAEQPVTSFGDWVAATACVMQQVSSNEKNMRIFAILMGLMLALGACTSSKFETYNGPEVTRILVFKEERKMYLMHGDRALKVYDVGLGFAPQGHKIREGDGRSTGGRIHD